MATYERTEKRTTRALMDRGNNVKTDKYKRTTEDGKTTVETESTNEYVPDNK